MTFFSFRRSWLLGGYRSEFESQSSLGAQGLSNLVDGFLRDVLPLVEDARGSLHNLKGRNARDSLLEGIASAEKDELFRLGGECASGHFRDTGQLAPFEVVSYSLFDRFEGQSDIVHRSEVRRQGSLPETLPLSCLGRAAPIRPNYFRFGLEHFSGRRFFAAFGANPSVTDSMLVDCKGSALSVRLTVETRSKTGHDPFERLPFFRAAARIIENCSDLALRDEYVSRLKGHED